MTIGLWDIVVPKSKSRSWSRPTRPGHAIDRQFQRGLITDDERYEQVVELWQRMTKNVSDKMMDRSTRRTRSG